MVGLCPEGGSVEKWKRQNQRDWQNFVDVSLEEAVFINA
jgi:hypothetical protein